LINYSVIVQLLWHWFALTIIFKCFIVAEYRCCATVVCRK